MAKNTNQKVSVSTLDKLLKELDTQSVTVPLTVGDESVDIEVRRDVPLQEFCDMVTEAADSCVQYDDDGQEHFVAALSDFAGGYVLLKHLTNIKTAEDVDKKEQQNDRLYALCAHTDIVSIVKNALPEQFVVNYRGAVCKQIEFKKQQLLSNERQLLLDCATKIDKASTSFAQFIELFQGVDPQEMMDMMGKITSMSEEKLGEAVVDSRDKDFAEQQSTHLNVAK